MPVKWNIISHGTHHSVFRLFFSACGKIKLINMTKKQAWARTSKKHRPMKDSYYALKNEKTFSKVLITASYRMGDPTITSYAEV